jgi:uncharacterized DUF497 family protein
MKWILHTTVLKIIRNLGDYWVVPNFTFLSRPCHVFCVMGVPKLRIKSKCSSQCSICTPWKRAHEAIIRSDDGTVVPAPRHFCAKRRAVSQTSDVVGRQRISFANWDSLFFPSPILIFLHRKYTDRRVLLGQTFGGRYLFIVYQHKSKEIARPIHARDMKKRSYSAAWLPWAIVPFQHLPVRTSNQNWKRPGTIYNSRKQKT